MDQKISELAKAVGLPEIDTKKAVEYLKHDILLSLYRKNPDKPKHMAEFNTELNQKIAQTYKEWYGVRFNPQVHSKNKKLPLFLFGIPGQGKTASYLAAMTEVAAALDLNLIPNVTDDYIPEMNDLVMVVQESAGENSALTYGGVPRAEEVTINGITETVLKKAVNYRFTVFKHCAGGVLLFDDAANAASVIQNVLLPVAQNGTFQGLSIPNACIGFTGNLGALDGTYTTEQSSALLTRVLGFFVQDTVENFLQRSYAYYNDDLGDVGYNNFLDRDKGDFAQMPKAGQKTGFPCSRSHDNAIQRIRSAVERHGGRGVGEEKALMEIADIAKTCLGVEMGQKLTAYYYSFMRGADPLAKEYIVENKPNKKKLDEKYSGGSGQDDMAFGYQFATACGDYASNFVAGAVADGKAPEEALVEGMKRFGRAVLNLQGSEFSYSLEHMKNKLANSITDFSTPTKDGRDLSNKYREIIAHTINDLEDCGELHREILIQVITDFDKLQNTNIHQQKKGPRKIVGE